MHTTKLVLSITAAIAMLGLAACGSSVTTTKAAAAAKTATPAMSVTTATAQKPATVPVVAKATAPAGIVLSDGTYQGTIGRNTSTLVVRNGQVVSYTTPTYSAKSISRRGNVVNIDKARATLRSASNNSMNIGWRYGSYSSSAVLTKI